MYTVFLSGGIASGKSTVARELVRLGAATIDLDQVSREVLRPNSSTVHAIAHEFGADLIDPATGALDRHRLAQRAFASPRAGYRLEQIELPGITEMFKNELRFRQEQGTPVCVVEIPLLDRVEGLTSLADEIVCVICPLELRRTRAVGRGMDAADFDARAALQPTDEYLRAHATTVFDNRGSEDELIQMVDTWWKRHEASLWQKAL